jgi:hypothetical protein
MDLPGCLHRTAAQDLLVVPSDEFEHGVKDPAAPPGK